MRYGDRGKETKLDEITGIVVIDEIESHLHAQLQADLLPKVLRLFPKIQFIITSHSPLFLIGMEKNWPEGSFEIYRLPDGTKVSARNFSEYEAVVDALDLAKQLKTAEKEFVVLVEGQTDKTILESAWAKLRPGKECPCAFTNGYDCNMIRNTLKRDEVFFGSPAKTFIGLLDFDSAFNAWNGAVKGGAEKWTIDPSNSEALGILATHPRHKGHIALMPVPSFRSAYASMKFGGDSSVSIELLFPDAIVASYVRSHDLPGGGKRLEFREDKKVEFAATTPSLPVSEFAAFEPVLRLIEDIISGARGKIVTGTSVP